MNFLHNSLVFVRIYGFCRCKAEIDNLVPESSLDFEHSIVAVCRRRDFDPDYEKSYAALEDLLKRLSLKVYISTRFFRFTELSMAYG